MSNNIYICGVCHSHVYFNSTHTCLAQAFKDQREARKEASPVGVTTVLPSGPAITPVSVPLPSGASTGISAGGVKHDQHKVRLELLPVTSLEEISKVLTFGAKKYADHNWTKGISYSRLIGACFRHLFSWARGEDKDPETGLSHLAHAGCCILFLIYMEKFRPDLDDRHKDPGTNVGVTTETKEQVNGI